LAASLAEGAQGQVPLSGPRIHRNWMVRPLSAGSFPGDGENAITATANAGSGAIGPGPISTLRPRLGPQRPDGPSAADLLQWAAGCCAVPPRIGHAERCPPSARAAEPRLRTVWVRATCWWLGLLNWPTIAVAPSDPRPFPLRPVRGWRFRPESKPQHRGAPSPLPLAVLPAAAARPASVSVLLGWVAQRNGDLQPRLTPASGSPAGCRITFPAFRTAQAQPWRSRPSAENSRTARRGNSKRLWSAPRRCIRASCRLRPPDSGLWGDWGTLERWQLRSPGGAKLLLSGVPSARASAPSVQLRGARRHCPGFSVRRSPAPQAPSRKFESLLLHPLPWGLAGRASRCSR